MAGSSVGGFADFNLTLDGECFLGNTTALGLLSSAFLGIAILSSLYILVNIWLSCDGLTWSSGTGSASYELTVAIISVSSCLLFVFVNKITDSGSAEGVRSWHAVSICSAESALGILWFTLCCWSSLTWWSWRTSPSLRRWSSSSSSFWSCFHSFLIILFQVQIIFIIIVFFITIGSEFVLEWLVEVCGFISKGFGCIIKAAEILWCALIKEFCAVIIVYKIVEAASSTEHVCTFRDNLWGLYFILFAHGFELSQAIQTNWGFGQLWLVEEFGTKYCITADQESDHKGHCLCFHCYWLLFCLCYEVL